MHGGGWCKALMPCTGSVTSGLPGCASSRCCAGSVTTVSVCVCLSTRRCAGSVILCLPGSVSTTCCAGSVTVSLSVSLYPKCAMLAFCQRACLALCPQSAVHAVLLFACRPLSPQFPGYLSMGIGDHSHQTCPTCMLIDRFIATAVSAHVHSQHLCKSTKGSHTKR